MGSKNLLRSIFVLLFLAAACDEPETLVTNIVHRNGSVTRIVEMKNGSRNFGTSSIQVPVDSTWTITDSISIGEESDTTWFRRAEKHFSSVEELNLSYASDSSYNRSLARSTDFRKRFRWFNTEYRFSEKIGMTLSHGYPIGRFMDTEQLDWYFSPGSLNEKRILGADSLKYRALQSSVNSREELWIISSLCSEFIAEIGMLLEKDRADTLVAARLKESEPALIDFLQSTEMEDVDETWLADSILNKFIGPGAGEMYDTEADSAVNIVIEKALTDFKDYSVRIDMPGRLLRTNGFVDSSHLVSWPVRSEFFLSEDYIMEAESVSPNVWAWVVSGIFVLFVLSGIILKKIKRG